MSPHVAILSVYDKTGLLDLAKGLANKDVRLLASGGTAKMIREAGFPVESVNPKKAEVWLKGIVLSWSCTVISLPSRRPLRCLLAE